MLKTKVMLHSHESLIALCQGIISKMTGLEAVPITVLNGRSIQIEYRISFGWSQLQSWISRSAHLHRFCHSNLLMKQLLVSLESFGNANEACKHRICRVIIHSPSENSSTQFQACSPWLRLAIYLAAGSGPASAYIPKGTRLTRLPSNVCHTPRLLVMSASHEPQHMPTYNALIALNDILLTTAIFVQVNFGLFAYFCSKVVEFVIKPDILARMFLHVPAVLGRNSF